MGGVQTPFRVNPNSVEEEEEPRSDSPTLSKEALKLMIAIAANEGFSIKALDVTNAF